MTPQDIVMTIDSCPFLVKDAIVIIMSRIMPWSTPFPEGSLFRTHKFQVKFVYLEVRLSENEIEFVNPKIYFHFRTNEPYFIFGFIRNIFLIFGLTNLIIFTFGLTNPS